MAIAASTLFGQDDDGPEAIRTQARSMVMTKYGIVATSQTLASAAGVKILEAGGSAVDAAIAANAMLGLVEPNSDGIGGDLFAIIYEAKTGKLYGLNASGWAPGRIDHRLSYAERRDEDAASRDLLRNCSWRCSRMGRDAQALRPPPA